MDAFIEPVKNRVKRGAKGQSTQEESKKEFQVKARRFPLPPTSKSREKQPRMSGRTKLLLRGNVQIRQAFPTGSKKTRDHVTEGVFFQVYILFILNQYVFAFKYFIQYVF